MEIIALVVISGFFHNPRNAIRSLPIKIPGALQKLLSVPFVSFFINHPLIFLTTNH
jgi:hypothetical protein